MSTEQESAQKMMLIRRMMYVRVKERRKNAKLKLAPMLQLSHQSVMIRLSSPISNQLLVSRGHLDLNFHSFAITIR